MDRYPYILGCLWGTALGDAVGLPREGLSRRRAARMYGNRPLQPDLVLGLGFCSDDTEHTQMVGRSLVASGGDVVTFRREFGKQLRRWLLTAPAGIGFATLRACLKLLVGFAPTQSGVFSAGNGPAMRSALLGVCAASEEELQNLVRDCTRITHTDPRAEEGALLVARAARLSVKGIDVPPIRFLAESVNTIENEELRDLVTLAVTALTDGKPPMEFADSQGWSHGVSGYINHSVPAALYCWAFTPKDFRQCVENAVLLGGDTDSVAAIAGAICGANLGHEGLPSEWLERIAEWPRNSEWMKCLASRLNECRGSDQRPSPPNMRWLATLPRNMVFTTVVLALAFRRWLPPY